MKMYGRNYSNHI